MDIIEWESCCEDNRCLYWHDNGIHKVDAIDTWLVYDEGSSSMQVRDNSYSVDIYDVHSDIKSCVRAYIKYLNEKYLGGNSETNN